MAEERLDDGDLHFRVVGRYGVPDPNGCNCNLIEHLEQHGDLDVNHQEVRKAHVGYLHFGTVQKARRQEHDREEERHLEHATETGGLDELQHDEAQEDHLVVAVHEVAIHVESWRPRLQVINVLVVVPELFQELLPLLTRLLRFKPRCAEAHLDDWILESLMLPVMQLVARAEVEEADDDDVLRVRLVVSVAALEVADEAEA